MFSSLCIGENSLDSVLFIVPVGWSEGARCRITGDSCNCYVFWLGCCFGEIRDRLKPVNSLILQKENQIFEKKNTFKNPSVATMFDLSLREWIKYVKFHLSSPTRNRDVHFTLHLKTFYKNISPERKFHT